MSGVHNTGVLPTSCSMSWQVELEISWLGVGRPAGREKARSTTMGPFRDVTRARATRAR
jgi:hypothetical protein